MYLIPVKGNKADLQVNLFMPEKVNFSPVLPIT